MTAQVPDQFEWLDEELAIVASSGPLFDPFAHGLITTAIHTACWRGYIATYGIDGDNRLVLVRLLAHAIDGVNGDHTVDTAPSVGGVRPRLDDRFGVLLYEQVALPLEFTGRFLIGADFAPEPRPRAGFFSHENYGRLLEVVVDAGVVRSVDDPLPR